MLEIFKSFASCTILTMSVYGFGAILFNKRDKNKLIYDILIFFAACILHSIFYLYFKDTLKTLFISLSFVLIFKFIFKLRFIKSIFVTLIYSVLTVIPDLLTLVGALYILGIKKDYYYNVLAGGIICNISVSLLMLLLTYIIRKPLRKLINMSISTNKKLIFISVLTLIALAFFFYNLISTFEFSNDIAGFLIAIIALIAIFFYIFKQKIDNNNISKKYDELLDIMKNYESDIEDQRTFIHETKNELSTIRSKIEDKEPKNVIIEYIDSIIGDKVSSDMSKYSKFKYLPSNGLKGFFYYKVTEAERKGINVSINIAKQIENSLLAKLDTKNFKDLARILGVYLDNAIEASNISKDKKLGIEIYIIKDSIEIIISNTYENEINKYKIGNEQFSTKGKNRGHGLLLVKRILNENKMFSSKSEINSNLFIQRISVKNNVN